MMDIPIIEARALEGTPNWKELFSAVRPLIIEIGCGKGEFLAQLAKRETQFNFLGIERIPERVEKSQKKCLRLQVDNVVFIHGNGEDIIPAWFKEQRVSKFLIQCPDPWPKRRHHKRRLVQGAFIQGMFQCLVPDGIVHINTDHEEYALFILEQMEQSGLFINSLGPKQWALETNEPIETIHHIKFKKIGRVIHYMTFQKKQNGSPI